LGIWARYAGARRDLVRRSYDAYRAVEQRLSRSVTPAPGGFQGRPAVFDVTLEERVLALTFDDGPHPENTPRLLDILRERGVRATFYLIGRQVEAHPEVAGMIGGEGHEIGNHTWSHRFLTRQSTRSIETELQRTHDAIEEATGRPVIGLRPPYGAVTRSLARWVDHRFGYRTINWSVDAADWEGPDAGTIRDRLLTGVVPGSIVLLHDPLTPTVEAMAETLDRLLEDGYSLVTVSDLIGRAS
jgi:peptidoglycan/xylan/chitin deacetylase (PgdA/CDA1 family)